MRIGIYDLYIDTLGGGERYILSIASFLSKNHDVEVFWDDKSILDLAEKKHGLNLKKVSVVNNIFSKNYSTFKRIGETRNYDVIFYISDGSIPFLTAKKVFLIFQFPVNWVDGKTITNTIKLRKVTGIICYTEFVKKHLQQNFNTPISVVNPPVDLIQTKPTDKENIILTVGRFTKGMNRKKHEVMVDSFKKMVRDGLSGWRLVIIGSFLPEDRDLIEDLEKHAKGYSIDIYANASLKKLEDYYKKSKIYWHAAGYGEDLEKHPEYAEHFGIATVEAMSAGTVPVVIKAGGQTEIVEDGVSGYLWKTLDELIDKTNRIIDDHNLWNKLSKGSMMRAEVFSVSKFNKKIEELLR